MTGLNVICDQYEHRDGLPDRELRRHALAVAIEAAERVLAAHGYPDPNRASRRFTLRSRTASRT